MNGDPGSRSEKNMEKAPLVLILTVLHQRCLRASVSFVSFEHCPQSGSADGWPPGCTCVSPWQILLGCHDVLSHWTGRSRKSFGLWGETHLSSWWNYMNLNSPWFMMVWVLPCKEPTKHVLSSGLLLWASVFTSAALNPLLLMALPSFTPLTLALLVPLRDHSFFLEFRNQFGCLYPCGSPVEAPI